MNVLFNYDNKLSFLYTHIHTPIKHACKNNCWWDSKLIKSIEVNLPDLKLLRVKSLK